MSRKRKDELVDRDELMNLAKVAKSWEFTCSFCFRKFDSAQAMGGHQNAHRNERKEENRLGIKGHIGHRMRTFLIGKKAESGSSTTKEGSSGHAIAANSSDGGGPSLMVKAFSESVESPKINAGCDENKKIVQPWINNGRNLKIEEDVAAKNWLELSLGVGLEEERGGKGKACVHDFNLNDHNLDLTLKL